MEKNAITNEAEIKYRGIKSMPFIIGNETFEKLGTIGTSTNMLVYLTTVFNMKGIHATTLVNVFNGTTNFATIIGAFLCDTYFGRYNTLAFASISSFLGMIVITLTAAISKLHPAHCASTESGRCPGPTPGQMTFLLTGLGLLVVGAGGIRPCNLSFGADQFDPNTESGRRGVNSFFNWYYFTYTFGMMISLTFIVYVQSDVNWAIGLGIPAFLMFLSCSFFFLGTRIYVKVKPEGSPMKSAVQVMVAAVRKRRLEVPQQPWASLFNHVPKNTIISKLPYTDQFRILDKGAIQTDKEEINLDGSASNPWRLSTMQQVEQVKCLARVLPIWVSFILYFITIVQQQTYVVFQALQSDRRLFSTGLKIPGATYIVFMMIALTAWIPIYDQAIIPVLRKITKKEAGITILQKMGVGMVLGTLTMIISGLVETRRRDYELTRPNLGVDPERGGISSLSGLWLVPQLTLAGVSEAFTVIAHIEFYYKQFPENMRSIGSSLTFVGMACGSYFSSFLVSVVHSTTNWLPEDLNKGKLDYYYYLVAVLGILNFGYFLVCASWFKYKAGTSGAISEIGMEQIGSEKTHV